MTITHVKKTISILVGESGGDSFGGSVAIDGDTVSAIGDGKEPRWSSGKKVLIVDDDAEIVELISEVLLRDGRFDIRTASSGYEAGIATEQLKPDVILLDYMLPDVNGNVVCQTLKSNPQFEDIKIIIGQAAVIPA